MFRGRESEDSCSLAHNTVEHYIFMKLKFHTFAI